MERFYKEFKFARRIGMNVTHALMWARQMRTCNYNPF